MRLGFRSAADLVGWLSGHLGALALSLILLAPRVSEACAVCTSGNEDENRMAFILTTAFLTFLPLTMIGAFILWLRRRILVLEASHEEARSAISRAVS
jgi:hypothetical protein